MDYSGNYIPYSRNFQRWDLQTRRLRLISDIMDDYQENVRRMIRLIGCELGISNHVFPSHRTASNLNVDDWLDQVSQITTNMYSPAENIPDVARSDREDSDTREPVYSFNRSPPLTRPNLRRGFVYTQLLEPRENSNIGITNEQIANATQSIYYDVSMNETRCPITWDQFEQGQDILRINNCGHIFGRPALIEWFRRHNRCPVCRASVLQNSPREDTPSTPLPTPSTINLQASAQMNISDRVSSILRSPPLPTPPSSERNAASNAINQIISGILTSVNGAVNTDTGYYESEFAFNVDDLLNAYTQLVGSPTSQTNPSSPNQ